MPVHPALEAALDLKRNTSLARSMRHQPLPEGVIDLIKCAGGCSKTCAHLAMMKQRSPETIREAAIQFLLLVAFTPDATAERQLGLNPNDLSRDQIRLHKRWLVRWLHPDHNSDPWQTMLFNRVLAAALQIEGNRMLAGSQNLTPIIQPQLWQQPTPVRARSLVQARRKPIKPSTHFSLYRMAQLPAIFVLIVLLGYSVIVIGNYFDSLSLLKPASMQALAQAKHNRAVSHELATTNPSAATGAPQQGDILLLHESW